MKDFICLLTDTLRKQQYIQGIFFLNTDFDLNAVENHNTSYSVIFPIKIKLSISVKRIVQIFL